MVILRCQFEPNTEMQLLMIEFISLLLLLLVTGVFWGPWLALHRSLHLFSKEEFIKITNIMAINLGRPMQVLMPLCLLFMLTSVLIYPNKGSFGFYLILSSLGCMIITFIVTMTTELPIVNKIKLWTSDTAPSDWNEIRDKWVKFHALRVFPALISFGLYLIAILHSD
jgi:uncharacterized membrane protein